VEAATLAAILYDRNAVALEDLHQTLRESPDLRSVGVFYGAAHMPDMARRLLERGFQRGRHLWFPAITVDLGRAGLDEADVKRLRASVGARLRGR
jgi:hypothetical protein